MTEEEVQERLSSEKNLLNKLGKGHGLGGNNSNHGNAGRQEGNGNLTPFMREVIASSASLDTAKNTALAFGVSKAHAHNLKNGYITRPNGKDDSLIAGKNKTIGEINQKASDLVMEALGLLSSKNMLKDVEKAKDMTAIAKDLASVVEKTTPDPTKNRNQGSNVFVYAPGTVNLNSFETIDVEPMEVE